MKQSARQFGLILMLLIGGALSACRTSGPDIPRYRPPTESLEGRSTSWGAQVWSEATAGADSIDQLPSLQTELHDPWLARLVARARISRTEAELARVGAAQSILEQLDEKATCDQRAILIAELADLLQAGLPNEVADIAETIVDDAIVEWNADAQSALLDGDLETAWTRFTWVAHAAADGRHPRVELEAIDHARRRADRKVVAGGEVSPLQPRVLAYTLRTLMQRHVDHPDWRVLTAGGFASLEEQFGSDGPSDLLIDIQRRFEAEVDAKNASSDPSTRTLKQAMENLGRRLQAASNAGDFETDVDAIRVFLDGMLAATDVRTNVFYGADAEMFKRMLDDSYIGIGVMLRATPDGIELLPVSGGPARRAGIKTGDVLLAVDGTSIDDLGVRGAMEVILGDPGSVVRLQVRHNREPDIGRIDTVDVIRNSVERETLHGWRQIGVDHETRPIWDWILDPECGIAYIAIREFTSDTDRNFRVAMRDAGRELKASGGPERQVEGLVIDLRTNRGGRLGATERLLDLFISNGSLFNAEDGHGNAIGNTKARRSNTRLAGLPIVFLIDEDSASAAELLSGTLQATNDAVVIGERSHGKGSVQIITIQPDGYLVVTQSWFLIPDRTGGLRLIDRLANEDEWGILPDVPSPATETETMSFLEERGDWRSNVGEDLFILDDVPTLETTEDRPLLDAVILLRARLLSDHAESDPPTASMTVGHGLGERR